MKIAVIGGGSSYTPELLDGLIERCNSIRLNQVVLHDISPERLDTITSFCQRMADHRGASFRIKKTLVLEEAVEGASFIILQIRVGGQDARHRDERLGLRHNLIGQETTGAGGFAKAIRTIPVVLKIAQVINRIGDHPWLINFTNPSGIITETLLRYSGVRTIGLCNIPIEMRIEISKFLGVEVERVEIDYFGLNHLGWIRGIRLNGVDVIEDVLMNLKNQKYPANIPDIDYGRDLLSALGMIPSPYLRYYYMTEEVLSELMSSPMTRAQEVMDIERQLFDYYKDENNFEKPSLLSKRGGAWYSRVALNVIEALISPKPSKEIVNTLNMGAIPGMPDDASVEVPCEISTDGVKTIAQSSIPEEVFGLMRQVKAYERLTIECALTRSREKALLALMANPLVRTLSKARAVLSDLIEQGEL